MPEKSLSGAQIEALNWLWSHGASKRGKWRGEGRIASRTMQSLCERGLVEWSTSSAGVTFWSITNAGRDAASAKGATHA